MCNASCVFAFSGSSPSSHQDAGLDEIVRMFLGPDLPVGHAAAEHRPRGGAPSPIFFRDPEPARRRLPDSLARPRGRAEPTSRPGSSCQDGVSLENIESLRGNGDGESGGRSIA